jgi:hypothetical protein
MMILLKSLRVFAAACAVIFISAIAFAKPPTYYHYYYVYPESMTWCGKLVDEVFTNSDKNWHFTEKKLTDTTAAFSVGDVRGFLRCLAKQSKESWVVIITTGNDSNKTKDLFEELRLGVCGKCSALAD